MEGLIDPRRVVCLPQLKASLSRLLSIAACGSATDKAEPFTSRRRTRNHVTEDTAQKPKGGVTRVQRPSFTIARNEEFAPCRMFGPKVTSGPLKMSLYF